MVGKVSGANRLWCWVFSAWLLLWPAWLPAQELLRAGVYLNPPLSYPERGGRPSGFVIDLLDYIAEQEQWRMEYVTCTWDSCNELLRLGEIDLLAPVSLSEAKQRRLDYNRESLYVNWGQIIMAGKGEIESPLDLNGKTVVALSSDVHFADLKELAERFDIDVRFLEVSDYESVLAWVEGGPVDAGLIHRTLDMSALPHDTLIKSSVIFNPAEIRIALSPRNGQLVNAKRTQRIDYQLTRLKGNSHSIYFQLQKRWFGDRQEVNIPPWLLWVLGVVFGLAVLLGMGVLLLRSQVRRQTAALSDINRRFTAFMNHLPGSAYMKDKSGRFVFVNSSWEQSNGLRSQDVVGRMPQEVWPDRGISPMQPGEQQVLDQQAVVEEVAAYPWDGTSSIWRTIRFPVDDASGECGLVGGISLDVTAEKEAEQQLSKLHRQHHLLLESAGDGIFGVNGVGRCTFVNQAALKILGYPKSRVIGSNLLDLIQHSEQDGRARPESASPIFRAYREGDRSREQDEIFWHADGSEVHVEYSAYPIADGDFPGAVVIFRLNGRGPAAG